MLMDKDKTTTRQTDQPAKSDNEGATQTSDGLVFDEVRARELYDMGMRDVELMKQLGVPRAQVVSWRRENELPANRLAVWNETRAMELYEAGKTDREIAEDLSQAGGDISPASIAAWRRKRDLGPNARRPGSAGRKRPAAAKPAAANKQKTTAANKPAAAPAEQKTPPKDEPQAKPQDEEETFSTPDIEGGTRRGHLVIVPTHGKQEEENLPPGTQRRGMHQRKRSRSSMPLPSVFTPTEPTALDFFDGLSGMPSGEHHFDEEDSIYMFAAILHLCRLDYDWDDDEVDEFLDAVQLAEGIIYDVSLQMEDFKDHLPEIGNVPPPPKPAPAAGKGSAKKKGGKKGNGRKK